MSAQTIEYRIRFSEDHFRTATLRYRAQVSEGRRFSVLKGVLGLIMVALAVAAVYQGVYLLAIVPVALIVLLFAAPRFDAWLVWRRIRRSWCCDIDTVIHLSTEGVSFEGGGMLHVVEWKLISKTRRFLDGCLLLESDAGCYWLPDAATDQESITNAVLLIRENVPDYND